MALILYVQDGNGDWRIVDGADPQTLQTTEAIAISGNSVGAGEMLEANATLPIPDPADPATQTQDVRFVVFPIKDGTTAVPPEPEADFGLPGS